MEVNRMRKRLIRIGVPVVVLAALAGGGVAWATAGDDDVPLTGSTLDLATNAALEHTGGGTVIETEVGDDGAAYGVEIRLDDGRVVEISLDENFNVVGRENDDEDGPEDDD
jgi:uncharacterized membrane protein YkoI